MWLENLYLSAIVCCLRFFAHTIFISFDPLIPENAAYTLAKLVIKFFLKALSQFFYWNAVFDAITEDDDDDDILHAFMEEDFLFFF